MTSHLETQDLHQLQMQLSADTMQGLQTERMKVAALLKNQGSEIFKLTDHATALLARDYKGVANQPFNAVIEVNNESN